MGERALAEALQHTGDLVLGDAWPRVLHAQELAASPGASDLQRDGPSGRRELDGVGQEVEADLADGALVGPKLRQVRLEGLDDLEPLVFGAEPYEPMTILDYVGQVERSFVQLVAPCFDAADVENLVDEIE